MRLPSLLALLLLPLAAAAQTPADYQRIVDGYLATRQGPEGISGVAAYVSLGDPGPDVALYAGSLAREGGEPVSGETLFQIGSNTKVFTAALLLALEARGKLSMEDRLGDWLPAYPAWKDVSIRRLLNMTSGLPTYSENPAFSRLQGEDPNRHFTPEELIGFAYPGPDTHLPPNEGWFYSNTNYILAGMIAEKAAGMAYGAALERYLFQPAGLHDTHYEPEAYPPEITGRMAAGYFENPACELYAPDCAASGLAPLIGRDVRGFDVSWAGAAGGIVSSPRELNRWVRALFAGRVLPPPQLEALLALVSTESGAPLAYVSAQEPRGFSLGLVRIYRPQLGAVWFYEGETLGYRTAFLFWPERDLLVAGAVNSQPEAEEDHLVPLLARLATLAMQAR